MASTAQCAYSYMPVLLEVSNDININALDTRMQPKQTLNPMPLHRQHKSNCMGLEANEFENLLYHWLLPRIASADMCPHTLHAVACVSRGWFHVVRQYLKRCRDNGKPFKICLNHPHLCESVKELKEQSYAFHSWLKCTVIPPWVVTPEEARTAHYPYPLCWHCSVVSGGEVVFASKSWEDKKAQPSPFFLNGIKTEDFHNSCGSSSLRISFQGALNGWRKKCDNNTSSSYSMSLKIDVGPRLCIKTSPANYCKDRANIGDLCAISLPLTRNYYFDQMDQNLRICEHCRPICPELKFFPSKKDLFGSAMRDENLEQVDGRMYVRQWSPVGMVIEINRSSRFCAFYDIQVPSF
jgi:hypothetical protein